MVNKLNKVINLKDQLFSEGLTKNSRALIVLSNTSLAELVFDTLKKERKLSKVCFLPHTETLPYDFFLLQALLRVKECKYSLNFLLPVNFY